MDPTDFDRFHVPAVVLIVVGVGLLIAGGGTLVDELVHERTYSVEPLDEVEDVDEDDIERYVSVDDYGHYDFSELSGDGQRIVRDALAADDRTITVTGQWNFAAELYPPHETGGGGHFVSYDGEYYLLEVEHDGPIGPFAGFAYLFPVVLIGFALVPIAVGGIALTRSRPLFPTAVVVGLGYPGAKYALYRVGAVPSGLAVVDVVVGVVLVGLAYGVLRRRY